MDTLERMLDSAADFEGAVTAGHMPTIVPGNMTDAETQDFLKIPSPAGYDVTDLSDVDFIAFSTALSDRNQQEQERETLDEPCP